MKNELTDFFSIIKREFNNDVSFFKLLNNRELAVFLKCNAHNEKFIGKRNYLERQTNFVNLDTGKESKMCVSNRQLYFLPKGKKVVSSDNEMVSFCVGVDGVKCIRINEFGLFVEKSDLSSYVVTKYYDYHSLLEISKYNFSAWIIDFIDSKIQEYGIKPDNVIKAYRKDNDVVLSVFEDNEILKQEIIQSSIDRTLYSMYFEYMEKNGFYSDRIKFSRKVKVRK